MIALGRKKTRKVKLIRCKTPTDILVLKAAGPVTRANAETLAAELKKTCDHQHLVVVGDAAFQPGALPVDADVAFAVVKGEGAGYSLWKMKIRVGVVVGVTKSQLDFRSVLMSRIEAEIMADA